MVREANKALTSYLKHLASSGKIAGTVRKNPLTAETVQKLFEAGELESAGWRKLLQKVERGSTLSNKFRFCCQFSSNSQLVAQQICPYASKSTNQRTAFLQPPQQMLLLRVKLIAPVEKRETSAKSCNETMLHDKLKVFVSRVSPP